MLKFNLLDNVRILDRTSPHFWGIGKIRGISLSPTKVNPAYCVKVGDDIVIEVDEKNLEFV